MRVAAMQPYFLPYLGYFSLIAATDRFVVFDPVQYIRRGWVNRNRILKPALRDPQFITVPVAKHTRDTAISQIQIARQSDWKKRIRAQVHHYRKKAPYFEQATAILNRCLEHETDGLAEFNVQCLQVVCDALQVDFHPVWFDELGCESHPPAHPGQWAVRVSQALGATSYVNPEGGREIFRPQEFHNIDVQLQFLSNQLRPYHQRNEEFIQGLSILDVLMFNSLQQTRSMITDDIRIAA